MKKLICEICGGTKFYFNYATNDLVMIGNGISGGEDHYECADCRHEMIVKRPPRSFEPSKPQEVWTSDERETPKTYGEETIEDIISELTELHKQEQILLNRLEYKLKERKL